MAGALANIRTVWKVTSFALETGMALAGARRRANSVVRTFVGANRAALPDSRPQAVMARNFGGSHNGKAVIADDRARVLHGVGIRTFEPTVTNTLGLRAATAKFASAADPSLLALAISRRDTNSVARAVVRTYWNTLRHRGADPLEIVRTFPGSRTLEGVPFIALEDTLSVVAFLVAVNKNWRLTADGLQSLRATSLAGPAIVANALSSEASSVAAAPLVGGVQESGTTHAGSPDESLMECSIPSIPATEHATAEVTWVCGVVVVPIQVLYGLPRLVRAELEVVG